MMDTVSHPLTADQCIQLRDQLFANKLDLPQEDGSSVPVGMYRYLIVIPRGVDPIDGTDVDAEVVVSISGGLWERCGREVSHNSVRRQVSEHIEATAFAKRRIEVSFHDHLNGTWRYPWSETAKDSSNNMPLLLLLEGADGRFQGVLMRETHMGQTDVLVANEAPEPDDALALVDRLRALPLDAAYGGWFKERNLDVGTLDEVLAATPETEAGQKMVVLYRNAEWVRDIWNRPKDGIEEVLDFRSIADFHGTRVSEAKKQTRAGLDVARANQTFPGDYDLLRRSTELIRSAFCDPDGRFQQHGLFEDNAAVKLLAAWWNSAAPEAHRHAAFCRLYVWDADNRMFDAMDPEEPALDAAQLEGSPSFTMFERDGLPTVAAVFFRGRAANVEENGGTLTFYADGEQACDIGVGANDVDEARYSAIGLKRLSALMPRPEPVDEFFEQ